MLTHSVMNGTVRLSDCARSRGAIIENLGVSPTSPDRRIKITAGQGGVSRLRRDYRSSSGACQRTVCLPFLKHATGREIVRSSVRLYVFSGNTYQPTRLSAIVYALANAAKVFRVLAGKAMVRAFAQTPSCGANR